MKLKLIILLLLASIGYVSGQGANDPKKAMKSLIKEQFSFAAEQYKYLSKRVAPELMPTTYYKEKDKVETSGTDWWCSGFYPGSLLYIYEHTKDQKILQEAKSRLNILEKEKYFTGNHDLGFMMFCSFGNAYRILGEPSYKETIHTSASSLATRYRPSIKSIQSWDSSKNFKCPVIIDNMMNLELLYWVSDNDGDGKYKDIAINHANSTIKNHYRPDYSSWHVIDYDLKTNKVLKKITWQGAADSSSWSRGQGWGLYGFTMMYRFTHDTAYLNQAKNIANYLLNHPNMPADMIPYWDFNASDIPNSLRDASAASLIASALLELGKYSTEIEREKYIKSAEKILTTLSSNSYRAKLGENGGFLLKHSVGALPFNKEVDVPLTYSDYYFLEALKRYNDWYL